MASEKVHLVGVGGVGVSALARLLAAEGREVSGCDRAASPVTDLLAKDGFRISIGHDAAHITEDTSLLVYSDAIEKGNPERVRAHKLGIPELSYFEALGKVANTAENLIAVSGAHGKTTTTAMLIDLFEAAGLDPTAVVGSLRAKTKNNFRAGKKNIFIVEADEYRKHFHEFRPRVLVILNIDADHLDCYRDLGDIQSAFRELAQKVPRGGFVVCDAKNERVRPVIEGLGATVVDYGKYFDPDLPLKVLPLNRVNAAAALAVADIFNIAPEAARQALADFAGTWRRFEYKGKTASGADVYDDYAHHPTEVAATLASVREQFPGRRIIIAFHPHLYSRTKKLLSEFAHAFKDADKVVIAPIFAAREPEDPSITSDILAEKISETGVRAAAVPSLEAVEAYLRGEAKEGDIVLTMGAGDIYKVAEALAH